MAGETILHIVGTLTADPELRFITSGDAVTNFTVASNPRIFDKKSGEWKDGDALFMRCNIWRAEAENVAESLRKGHRVIVSGRLRQRQYEKDGQKRTVMELEVDEIGPSLKWARVVVTKQTKSDGSSSRSAPASSGASDAGWDEPPF